MNEIQERWSLLAFARNYERFQVGPFQHMDPETGEMSNFKSCIFTDMDGEKTFVRFSSKLGELTPKQIAEQCRQLQVVQLASGKFTLCKQGESSWEDVELPL